MKFKDFINEGLVTSPYHNQAISSKASSSTLKALNSGRRGFTLVDDADEKKYRGDVEGTIFIYKAGQNNGVIIKSAKGKNDFELIDIRDGQLYRDDRQTRDQTTFSDGFAYVHKEWKATVPSWIEDKIHNEWMFN